MTAALDRPVPASLITAWTFQPIAVLLVAVLAFGYAMGVRRLPRAWPRSRSIIFAAGVLLLLWTSCGAPGAYAASLFWVWTSQTLVLWLVVPVILVFGHPLQLARATAPRATARVLGNRVVRIVSNPFVSPALVPILSFGIFFGPLPGLAIGTPAVGWALQLVLVPLGAGMALWLAGLDEDAVSTNLAGMALAIGMIELVIDALPGIVMRLNEHIVSTFFDYRTATSWAPGALTDQRTGGAVIWFIAEIIDLPFLVLAYRRWRRVDAKDAAKVDAVLEAERSARGAETDEPWWLSDPAMRTRLKNQR